MDKHHTFIIVCVILAIIGMTIFKYGSNQIVLIATISGLLGILGGIPIGTAIVKSKDKDDAETS